MKIINQTPEEMTLTHPSMVQTVTGSALAILGGCLFVLSAIGAPDALFASHTAFIFFGIGLFILFTNAMQVIDINKTAGTIRVKRRVFLTSAHETYQVADVEGVEVRPRQDRAFSEAFLVLHDGTRVLIDYEHRTETETSIAKRVAQFLETAITEPSRT